MKSRLIFILSVLLLFHVAIYSQNGKPKKYKGHSVLQNGKWFKIAVQEKGIYRISYDDLIEMGIDPQTIDPRNIGIYGNGGEMLPENNSDFRYDDLVQNAIKVVGEEDGTFDPGDYILFYGLSPDTWKLDTSTGLFYHIKNLYSDYTYYFLNPDIYQAKRIQKEYSTIIPQSHNVTKFNDYQFYEKELHNLIGSGKLWFGEVFNNTTIYDFPQFSFPNIDTLSDVTIKVDLAARSFITSTFAVYATGMASPLMTTIYPVSQSQNTDYAKLKSEKKSFLPSSSNIEVSIEYIKSTQGSTGWLNYIEINTTRHLSYSGDQMHFRNRGCAGQGNVTEYKVSDVTNSVDVWDVSNPLEAKEVVTSINNGTLVFRLPTDTLKEFVAFNGSSYHEIEFVGEVENQDLHSLIPPDIIIVTHPDFISQAQRLADLHLSYDNLSSCIVTTKQVYNEFASGKPDVTAIRDFVKLLYDKSSSGSTPRYLLLFGDGTYDNKNILGTNSNFIPTYQAINSVLSTATFVSDDYFGLLEAGEGLHANGSIDIGIGRLPVQNIQQAEDIVNKIEHYMSPSDSIELLPGEVDKYGDWRNVVCFVADDEDGNLHFSQAEHLAKKVEKYYPSYNVDKIYLDAYPQVSTPGGDRYPEVNKAINERISKGSLLINYIGHGGESGWSYENVIEISDIVKWNNYNSLPVFLTATCEFTRFDDPLHTTAGEHVVLNPNGGGIAIFSTSRVSFASSNFSLTISFYDHVFEKVNDQYLRLGDLIRLSKNDNNNDVTLKNFILLGDPALQIDYPQYSIITSRINSKAVDTISDTLKAYQRITVDGYIADQNENIIKNFDGLIYPKVFDKASEVSTLNNDNDGSQQIFFLLEDIIYKGRASIKDGEFSFSFIMPKDINFNYGKGKISYYAENGIQDANGYFDGIIIGGSDNSAIVDNNGPLIQLFINNTKFISGGLCDKDPLLIAYLSDENGINAFGNGIGHEIVAVLDENTESSISLNSYFEADIDSYKSGNVMYNFSDLTEGMHILKLKAWDMLNNSSEATLQFFVTEIDKTDVNYVMNYPNPFIDETHFFFDHNNTGKELDITLEIYTITGRQVLSRRFNVLTEDNETEFFTWDGRDDHNNRLSQGVYVYRIIASDSKGFQDYAFQKLVLMK